MGDMEYWAWLVLAMRPNNRKTNSILAKYGYDVRETCKAVYSGEACPLDAAEKRRVKEVDFEAVKDLLRPCIINKIHIVPITDPNYPRLLRETDDPPAVLFAAGDTSCLNAEMVVASVGTRKVSDYGRKAIRSICGPLASMGATIVSGLAVGSDTEAHRAAVEAGGRTVGVLGCGMFTNYPAENAQLKRDIIAHGGAVISELLPNSGTMRGYFKMRNRIISGVSQGVFVAEAGESSGSLITASCAVDQGRDVFCLPPRDIFDIGCMGNISLLRQGAIPVFGYTDIIGSVTCLSEEKRDFLIKREKQYMLGIASVLGNEALRPPAKPPDKPSAKQSVKPVVKVTDAPSNAPLDDSGRMPADKPAPSVELTENENEVMKLIGIRPESVETLTEALGMDYGELMQSITTLEVKGLIFLTPEGFYKVK